MELLNLVQQFKVIQFKNLTEDITDVKSMIFRSQFYYVWKVCKYSLIERKSIVFISVDKLAALWPFIGIVSIVLTLVIIIIIFEKRQKSNKKTASTDDDEQDRASDP